MNRVIINYDYPNESEIEKFALISLELESNRNYYLQIDNGHFENIFRFTKETTSVAFEFYLLSVIVYNIDKLLPRKKLSLDGWCREISFDFQVENVKLWNCHKSKICQMLSFLTGDYWDIEFIHKDKCCFFKGNDNLPEIEFKPDKICLFSGGLDSLIGAYSLLNSGTKTLLVSHYDGSMHGPKTQQENIKDMLSTKFATNFDWTYNRIGAIKGSNNNKLEATFRSRSILFIGIASYLAHNLTPNLSFLIPENGTISLNLPLSPSRRSSCSTKTTHPYVLSLINDIFKSLGVKTSVENPFEFKTKGEMILPYKNDLFLKDLVLLSNSCGKSGHNVWWYKYWHNNNTNTSYDTSIVKHCGKCMPCIYRRAAMNKVGWDDGKYYGDDIFLKENWDWQNGKKNKRMKDVKTFLKFISKKKDKESIKKELLINGSISLDKLDNYAKVVVKTIKEINDWFKANKNKSNFQFIKDEVKL